MEPILEARNLTKEFAVRGRSTPFRAVDDVSLSLFPSETLGVVGESGSGKSTLSRMLIRLLEPTRGSVWFEGTELTALKGRALRRARPRIQMVFQDPYASLDPRMTVAEIVAEPLVAHRRDGSAMDRARVIDLLERVGLSEAHLTRFPHEFSGGQRQRIAIARALALNPSVIILDEAVSALDVSTQAVILRLLRELQEEFDLSYIFVGHNLAVVRQIAHRVAVMYRGSIVEQGDIHQVYDSPTHEYTRDLLDAVPIDDPRLRGSRAPRFAPAAESL